MKQYLLIIHKPGPAWKAGEVFQNQNLLEHGANIHSLYRQGIVIEGGPFLDHSGGMAILRVEDANQAEEIVKQDPAIKWRFYSLNPPLDAGGLGNLCLISPMKLDLNSL